MDLGASRFDTIMKGGEVPALVDFQELVLTESKVAHLLMFRTVHSPWDIFISDRGRTELIKLRPPEGWGVTSFEIPVR